MMLQEVVMIMIIIIIVFVFVTVVVIIIIIDHLMTGPRGNRFLLTLSSLRPLGNLNYDDHHHHYDCLIGNHGRGCMNAI